MNQTIEDRHCDLEEHEHVCPLTCLPKHQVYCRSTSTRKDTILPSLSDAEHMTDF